MFAVVRIQERLIVADQIPFLCLTPSWITLGMAHYVGASQSHRLKPALMAGNPFAQVVGNTDVFGNPAVHREQDEHVIARLGFN